jgi:hypothetical protein
MTPVLIETAASVVTVLASVWAIARWTGKVDQNTAATERLTDSFNTFTEKVTDTLADHEVRITLLERAKR